MVTICAILAESTVKSMIILHNQPQILNFLELIFNVKNSEDQDSIVGILNSFKPEQILPLTHHKDDNQH
jgi:hypothetical protein